MICGAHLPGGTYIGMSAPVVNCDKGIFGEDAEEFRPERWLDASPEEIKNMERAFFSVSCTIPSRFPFVARDNHPFY